MSQLKNLFFAFLLFISTSAHAFQDTKVHLEIQALKGALTQTQSLQQRVDLIEKFKNFMDNYLQSVNIEQTEKGRAEFASLNEFGMALFTINVSPRNPASTCRSSSSQVRNEGRLPDQPGKLAPSAEQALELIKLVCR